MNTISVREVLNLNNPIIVDIRNAYYYSMGHIVGAINIPYYNLLNNYSHYLNKYSIYYLYCDTGDKSILVVQRLNGLGYHLVNIEGGYLEYQKIFGG